LTFTAAFTPHQLWRRLASLLRRWSVAVHFPGLMWPLLISLMMPVDARLATLRTFLLMCHQPAPNPRTLNQRIAEQTDPLEVLRLYAEYGHAYNEVNMATTWSRLGRARGRPRSLILSQDGTKLHALRERTVRGGTRWKARHLANTAHALAKLQLTSGEWRQLWDLLATASCRRIGECKPQELANTAWAFATAGHAVPALLDAIAAEAERRVGEFNAQNLANTAWAFATAGHPAPTLLDAIAAEAAPRVGEFLSQELANTAWAFVKAGHAAPALLDAIASEAALRVGEFKPQELANTAWAFATAGHAAPALLDAIASEAAPRMGEFKPQELANMAWAFATAGHAAPVLLDAIAAEAALRVGEFKPQELANSAWAFATAGHAAPALFDAIAAEAAPRVGESNPQDFANTAWAFATAGHAAPALFDAIAAEAAPRVGEFNPQALANTAWAFATAGHAAPALLDAVAAEAAPRVGELDSQALANTAWSLAVADTFSSAALVTFFSQEFCQRCDVLADSFSAEQLRQLHQWRLWYTHERGQTKGLPSHELLQRCRVAFSARDARPSKLQRQVGSTLSGLGLNPQEEVWTEEGYSLDYVVERRGQQVAIEVDGPWHFVGRKPNGSTLLKRRQLRHLGWRLVSIPYWEWNELEKAPTARNTKQSKKKGTLQGSVMTLQERQMAYVRDAIARQAKDWIE
jgi:hypothetical protein